MDNYVTVLQLNKYLKDRVDADENLKNIVLKGEVSNFTNHIKSGHFYFTLKDSSTSIRAIMFKTNACKVKFDVQNGMNVIVVGTVKVFERDGLYQIYCQHLEPDGIGGLHLAFEQLKQKLSSLGYFNVEHKKQMPNMPKKIGIITSKTGAALQDMLNILSRRYPIATVVLISTLVQGEDAPQSICEAILLAQQSDIDVLIVGRGGGSIEDLWAFNDERVAKAIYDCEIPVVSAVGHEVDFTISDFVADLRAPTPSAAAELITPDINNILGFIEKSKISLDNHIVSKVNTDHQTLKHYFSRLESVSPSKKILLNKQKLVTAYTNLNNQINNKLTQSINNYKKNVLMLEALSPLKVLTRGYSITYCDDEIITSAKQLKQDDIIKTVLVDGDVVSKVIK